MMTDGDHTFIFNMTKLGVAGLLFVLYYMLIAIAAFVVTTTAGANLVLAGLSGLGPVIGAIAANMYPKGNDQDKATIAELSKKVPPATVPAADLTINQPGGSDAV